MPSRETVWTGISLGTRTLVQAAVAAVAATLLDSRQGGLWFVFASLGGIVQLLDMGLGVMILRAASQLQAGSARLTERGLSDERTPDGAPNSEALCDLQKTTAWVYGALVVGVWVLAGLVGLTSLRGALVENSAYPAWIAFALGTSLQLFFSQKSNFLWGVGQLVRAQKITVFGLVASFGAAAVAMVATHSLLAACVALVVGWAFAIALAQLSLGGYRGGKFSWALLKALWPNSLRTGIWRVAFACFYYLPVLIIVSRYGVELAGQYGFTIQVFLLLLAMAQIPIASVLPKLNAMALGPAHELCGFFCRRMRYQIILYLLCGIPLIILGPMILNLIHARTTLLATPMLAFLFVHFFFETHRHTHVMITNAFNHLDYWKVDVLSALAMLLGGCCLLGHYPFWLYLGWMGVVAWCGNFHVAVRHSLRLMRCSFASYCRAVLGLA